jgi:hypothetical protein
MRAILIFIVAAIITATLLASFAPSQSGLPQPASLSIATQPTPGGLPCHDDGHAVSVEEVDNLGNGQAQYSVTCSDGVQIEVQR